VLTQRRPRNPRLPALGMAPGVCGGYQPTQRRPPHGTGGKEGHPRLALIDPRTTACRCPTRRARVRTRVHACRFGGLDGEVDPEDRGDTQPRALACPPHRGVQAVAVGQADDGLPDLGCPLHERLRQRGAVAQRMTRGDLQVGERDRHRTTRRRVAVRRVLADPMSVGRRARALRIPGTRTSPLRG